MTTTRDPLTGLFPTGRELTDYREMPGYAKRAADVPAGSPGAVARTMARLGYPCDNEKAA